MSNTTGTPQDEKIDTMKHELDTLLNIPFDADGVDWENVDARIQLLREDLAAYNAAIDEITS